MKKGADGRHGINLMLPRLIRLFQWLGLYGILSYVDSFFSGGRKDHADAQQLMDGNSFFQW
jgi:hypothetical protein